MIVVVTMMLVVVMETVMQTFVYVVRLEIVIIVMIM